MLGGSEAPKSIQLLLHRQFLYYWTCMTCELSLTSEHLSRDASLQFYRPRWCTRTS